MAPLADLFSGRFSSFLLATVRRGVAPADRQATNDRATHVMPDLETLERLFALADKYGSSWSVVVIGATLLVLSGRAITKGAKHVWSKAEPHFEGILGAHRDLMETAKEQIPRQTAILERLTEGQHENSVLLASIDTHVRTLIPAPSPASGEPCSTRS